MNRFTTSKGSLTRRGSSMSDSSGQILQGTSGTLLRYDKAGQRIGVTNADGSVEAYSYSTDGYLENSHINGQLRARRRVDSLGRTLQYQEWEANGNVRQSKASSYDADNRLLSETTSGTNTNADGLASYKYYDGISDSVISQWGAGSLAQVIFTPQQSNATGSATWYHYVYWDSAKQDSIAKYMGPGNPGITQLTYNRNGHLISVSDVNVNRNLSYFNNAQGQVLRRVETMPANATSAAINATHNFYYAAGRRIGDVGNDGNSYRQSYAEQLALPLQDPNATAQSYKTQTPITSADFGQNYEPINANYPVATGSTYTVRGGDTLRSIAQQMWGDAAMWYLIADANHLSGSEVLVSGQTLVIPNKVTNIHNNANTYRPYNPGEVIGHIDPTIPQPPPPPAQDGQCAMLGVIAAVIVYVVVLVYSHNPVIAAAASNAAGQIGTAIGNGTYDFKRSITHTLLPRNRNDFINVMFNPGANGMPDGKFDYGSVARSAAIAYLLSGPGSAASEATTAGEAAANAGEAAANAGTATATASQVSQVSWGTTILNGAAQGAASTALDQVLQGRWNWREIGAGALGGAAGAAAGRGIGEVLKGADKNFTKVAQSAIGNAAGGWASSQALGFNAQDTRARMGQAFVSGFASGMAEAVTTSAMHSQGQGSWSDKDYRNGMDVESDNATTRREAFGNAIGEGLAASGQPVIKTLQDSSTPVERIRAENIEKLGAVEMPDLGPVPQLDLRDNRGLLNDMERGMNPSRYTSVEGAGVVARNGDNISRILGTSDPQAIGNFMRANGLTGDGIEAGRNYFVPSRTSAYGDASVLGQVALNQGNTRLAAAVAFDIANESQRMTNRAISDGVTVRPWNMRDASAALVAQAASAPSVGSSEWFRTASDAALHANGYQTVSAYDPAVEGARQRADQRVATSIGLAAGGPVFTGWASGAQLLGAPDSVVNNIGVAQTGLVMSLAAPLISPGAVITRPVDPRFDPSIDSFINPGKQSRHVLGTNDYESPRGGKSYFGQVSDAQDVLSAYQSGQAVVVGRGGDGGPIVRFDAGVGFNHNVRAGYLNQPTNIFWIKGSSSVSVVPVSPTKGQ